MKTITLYSLRMALFSCVLAGLVMTACKKKKDEEVSPTEETPTFRGTKIDYNVLTATTAYNNSYFVNSSGDSTVDRTEGHNYNKMIRAIDAYGKTVNNTGTVALVSADFSGMFSNTNSKFTGIYAPLNLVAQNLKEITATSKSATLRADVLVNFDFYFDEIVLASASTGTTATAGVAGKLDRDNPATTSKYLVTGQGIEMAQVISKSMIGAIQLDYICNVLLNTGLDADNTKEVTGKKYTALEHNWDLAYGILTLNSIYAGNATPTSNGGESFIGSYIWEYCKTVNDPIHYANIHPAFLKGRAAVVNNDMTEVRAQAAIIRNILEKAVARAAVGYMGKYNAAGATAGVQAHAIGEGLGFVYSTRFCSKHGADDAFSDDIINDLGVYSGTGFWNLTALKTNTAAADINTKFGL